MKKVWLNMIAAIIGIAVGVADCVFGRYIPGIALFALALCNITVAIACVSKIKQTKHNKKEYIIYEANSEMWKCDDTHFPNEIAFRIQWYANVGFGELTFVYNTKSNLWTIDDEYMSEEFCYAVLRKWLNGIYTGERSISKLKEVCYDGGTN